MSTYVWNLIKVQGFSIGADKFRGSDDFNLDGHFVMIISRGEGWSELVLSPYSFSNICHCVEFNWESRLWSRNAAVKIGGVPAIGETKDLVGMVLER